MKLAATPGLKVLSLPFDQEDTTVLIGSYLSHEAAHEDVRAALGSGAHLHGAIVVSKDLDGKVSVEQSDHMVREGAQGLGTLGLLSGIMVLPLAPLFTGVGAAIGGLLGEALHLLAENKVKGQAAPMLPLGCAVLILACPSAAAGTVEPVVSRAVSKAIGQGHGHHVQALRVALAAAEEQLAPNGSR